MTTTANLAPAPDRRPRFPLGTLVGFVYFICAQPAAPAAVREARRWAPGRRAAWK
jgi:hypothetical protein